MAEILVSQRMSEEHDQRDTQEDEPVGNQVGFDLNIEDLNSEKVCEETHEMLQDIQENPEIIVQNVQANAPAEPSFPQVDQLTADPAPQASGSFSSVEVHLMAQQTTHQTPNLNFSTSTMESEVGKFLVSPLLTPSVLPSPPPITNKHTSKLPNISDLFDSLDTFVTKEGSSKEKGEASSPAPSTKPSRAEKLASRALRVATKTHQIACVLTHCVNPYFY